MAISSSNKQIIDKNIDTFINQYATIVYNNIQQQLYFESLFSVPVPNQNPTGSTRKNNYKGMDASFSNMFNII